MRRKLPGSTGSPPDVDNMIYLIRRKWYSSPCIVGSSVIWLPEDCWSVLRSTGPQKLELASI